MSWQAPVSNLMNVLAGSPAAAAPTARYMRNKFGKVKFSPDRREAHSITHLSGESMTSRPLGQSKLYYILVLAKQYRDSLLRGALLLMYCGR